MVFRPLKEDEIEVRVATCNDRGVSLLLYKNARVDRSILDETVGPVNWQCRFYECKGNLFCSVGIRSTALNHQIIPEEWVWKDDAGAPSNMEAEKGEASDAFKRACFKWGIGVELYTAPFIWIPADKCNIKKGRNGKPACYDKFHVERIKTEDGKIVGLAIRNGTKNVRSFIWQADSQQ